MLSHNLLPKAAMQADAHAKLSDILLDIQKGFQAYTDKVARSYDIDNMEYEDLLKLIESYSLADLYASLPPYYKGSLTDSYGNPYAPRLTALDKVKFARTFIRCMLRMRKDVGVVEMFDTIMGMLGVSEDKYVVLQTFQFHDGSTGETRFVKRRLYTSPRAGIIFPMYAAVPNSSDMFPMGADKNYYTPTQTITIDVLTNLAAALGAEFIVALRNVAMFLKPNHVVIEDLVPTIYMYSSGFYNINLSRRDDKTVTPAESIYPVPFSFDWSTLDSEFTVDGMSASLTANSLDFEALGVKAGMVISMTGWTNEGNNTIAARVVSVAGGVLVLNTNDCTLTYESSVFLASVTLHVEYDHSFQDGLVAYNPLNLSYSSSLSVVAQPTGGKITRASGSFITDGFKVGSYLKAINFSNAINNFDILKKVTITNVTALELTTDNEEMVDESPSTIVALAQYQKTDTKRDGTATRSSVIEQRTDTLTPVIYQNNIIPTLATGGSYVESYSVLRTGALDSIHNNDLNPRAGGAIFFGYVITGTFGVTTGKFSRASGSWITDGFEIGDLISTEDFTTVGNNITKIKVLSVTATLLEVDASLTDEVATPAVVHLEMKKAY